MNVGDQYFRKVFVPQNALRVEEIISGGVTTTYIGDATVGTPENAPRWQIRKIVATTVDTTTTTVVYFPDAKDDYAFTWSDRASLTYL